MDLTLYRVRFLDNRTVGQLYVDGEFQCFTLEDVVREVPGQPVEKWKVWGETAIPQGYYKVVLQNSPKFGIDTMTLLNVPGFSHIRIHGGNTEKDTEGCILVGYKIHEKGVIIPGTSKPALLDLKGIVKQAILGGEEVYVTITNVSP